MSMTRTVRNSFY